MAERTCSIDGCDRGHDARGFCQKHYRQERRRGNLKRVCAECGCLLVGRPNSAHCSSCTPSCLVEDCCSPPKARGYCNKHYQRIRSRGVTDGRYDEFRTSGGEKKCSQCLEVKSISSFNKSNRSYDGLRPNCRKCANVESRDWRRKNSARQAVDVPDWKRCYQCERVLASESFTRQSSNKDGLNAKCRDCSAQHKRKRLAADPDYNRRQFAWQKYRLALEQYDTILAAGCRICGAEAQAIDHDHRCCPGSRTCGECVRGGLCSNCNMGLGRFLDTPDLLRKAADYLDEWEARRERRMEVPRLPD